jgi:hypothetical protein
MEDIFNDLLGLEDVEGVMLVSFNGELIFEKFIEAAAMDLKKKDWRTIIQSLNDIREADLVFDRRRIYIRRTNLGYLLIAMGPFVSVSKVRLNCDVILPALKEVKSAKGFGAKLSELKL